LPHISNFNDFNPLLALDQLDVYFLEKLQTLTDFKAVILPGSKNTRFDLNWIHASGWIQALFDYAESGGHVLGICGGYQIMGKTVDDPQGLEAQPGISDGLNLLPIETILQAPKTTTLTQFSWNGLPGTGYEIHMGRTTRTDGKPLFEITDRDHRPCRDEDGCVSADSKLMGTYIHGLFDNPSILRSWLNHIGLDGIDVSEIGGIDARNRQYDLLAEHFQKHVDVERIMKLGASRE
jgi:adenosylcobyric acid synthase